MYRMVEKVLNEPAFRIRLAKQGNALITSAFSWDQSVMELEKQMQS
jgi:hypothetical protein